jgi:hypothetical protein
MSTPNAAPAPGPQGSDLGFAEPVKPRSWKAALSQPAVLGALVIGIAIAGLVAYLEFGNPDAGLPAPEVSYALLPNEGRTSGVPIAIKLNQIAVFVIDDPMEGGAGASRAPELVERLQNAVSDLKQHPGRAITYLTDGVYPEIILQNMDGTERRVLIRLTEGDVTLAGGIDPKRLARVWAERLTDSLKVLGFGEAPEFSVGTDFGNAIETLYASAQAAEGTISKGALEQAFTKLTDAQKLALETVPLLPAAQPENAAEEMPQVQLK